MATPIFQASSATDGPPYWVVWCHTSGNKSHRCVSVHCSKQAASLWAHYCHLKLRFGGSHRSIGDRYYRYYVRLEEYRPRLGERRVIDE